MKFQVFKPIKDYLNYEISNLGNIYNAQTNKPIKTRFNRRNGYIQVDLHRKGTKKTFYVHRLVALTFLGESDLDVNHKDGLKTNNDVDNLEWCSKSENMIHARRLNLVTKVYQKGINNGNSKLNEDNVLKIRESSLSIAKLSEEFKVSRRTIGRVLDRKSWKHI